MYHNITFKVTFFAGDREEWRVYTDSGQYYAIKSIEEISEAIRRLLISSAEITIKRLQPPGELT